MAAIIEKQLLNEEPSTSYQKSSRKLQKQKRYNGQQYTNKSGRIVEGRKIYPLGDCKKRCNTKITIN